MKRNGHFPKPLPPAEQIALCMRAQAGDTEAAHQLVLMNWGFLHGHARRFAAQTSLLDIDDLMNIGAIAMYRAIAGFKKDRSERFISYATWWVTHDMREAVVETAIRLSAPIDLLTRVWANRFERDRQKLRAMGLDPDAIEAGVAKMNDMTRSRLFAAENLRIPPTSMDQSLTEDTTSTLHDVVQGEELSVEDRLADATWLAHLQTTIALLGSKMPFTRRVVLAERILAERSLAEVGERLGLSREGVRQIELRLLKELRSALRDAFPAELGAKSDPIVKRGSRNFGKDVR